LIQVKTGLTGLRIMSLGQEAPMAEAHHARVVWSGSAFGPTKSVANYSREFRAEFEGKPPIHGSADPAFHGDPPLYNPEDLLMTALSACHMLSYLAVCAHAGIVVVSYEDRVVGTVARRGYKAKFVDVLLHPKVVLEPGSDIAPGPGAVDREQGANYGFISAQASEGNNLACVRKQSLGHG
jgi:organic hydroperoxide reductase OsmC/OhrA